MCVCVLDIDECKLQNGGCSHECTNTAGGHVCHCPSPLLLDHHNTTCVSTSCVHVSFVMTPHYMCANGVYEMCVLCLSDVTSCALRNGGCDHMCSLGSDGHIQCSCKAGWELSSDQRTCVGKTQTLCVHLT